MATASRAVPTVPEGCRPYLFTADDFNRMAELDLIPDDRRVELWEGVLFEKLAKTRAHVVSASKVNQALARSLPPGWFLSPENPVTIGARTVPLPDMAVIRGRPDDYNDRVMSADDVALIVEVSESSLRRDTGVKLKGYAAALAPAYWVVNLRTRIVEVYTGPRVVEGTPGFETARPYRPGESIPLSVDGRVVAEVAVTDLIPWPEGGAPGA